MLRICFFLGLSFFFLEVKFCIITRREFLELDKEITQCKLESVDIAVELSKPRDEDLYLRAKNVHINSRHPDYECKEILLVHVRERGLE